MRARTGLMAAGTPTMAAIDGEPVGQGGVVGEVDPAEDQAAGEDGFGGPPPDGAEDRPGGHDGPATMAAATKPMARPANRAMMGCHLLAGHGGGQQADDDPGDVEHDLGLADGRTAGPVPR